MRLPPLAPVAVAIGLGAVVVVLGALAIAPPRGDGAMTELADDTVVAVLQQDGAVRSPGLVAALRRARAEPGDASAARAAASLMIDEGRDAGDSRLVGAALGILRPALDHPDSETLTLAATARQYQHDFDGALGMLDQAIELDPRNLNALLIRATIRTVVGTLGAAQDDCARLATLRQDVGFLCQSTALLPTAQAPEVAARLERILARPGLIPDSLLPWAVGLTGEIAMNSGNDAAARAAFERVLTLDSGALRERVMLADILLRQSGPGEVSPLLADAPATDGVLIRRALAGRALDRRDTASEAELARRVRLNRDLGLDAHSREDAMYLLWLADDPAAALDRALANWALQHEIEDAQLLIDAAVAAGDPAAAAPVLDWMAAEDIMVPALRIPDAVRAAAAG